MTRPIGSTMTPPTNAPWRMAGRRCHTLGPASNAASGVAAIAPAANATVPYAASAASAIRAISGSREARRIAEHAAARPSATTAARILGVD